MKGIWIVTLAVTSDAEDTAERIIESIKKAYLSGMEVVDLSVQAADIIPKPVERVA